MNPSKKAVALFTSGHNCAQATSAAFAEELGLDAGSMLRAMAGFGGGLGGARELCGAVSAMVYVAGLRFGNSAPPEKAEKKVLYDLVKTLVREFTAQHGTTCCRDLLRQASCVANPDPSERTAEYYSSRPCARLVETAADILARRVFASASPRTDA